jgi:Predicted membrane protein (DUF2157)
VSRPLLTFGPTPGGRDADDWELEKEVVMSAPSTAHAPAPRPADQRLSTEVTTWVSEGLITEEQGARLLARGPVAAPPAPHRPATTSVVAEALGYLGGVVVLVGAILIGARVWHQLDTTGRLAVLGLAAALLVAAGAAVPTRLGPPGQRLRAVLWTASLGATAATFGVFAVDVLDLDGPEVGLVAAGTATVLGVLLFLVDRALLLQIGTGVAALATAGTLAAVVAGPEAAPGVAVWAGGAVWVLLGWGELLQPRIVVRALGGAAMIFGAMFTLQYDAGLVFALATATLIVVMALLARDPLLLAVGAIGAFQSLPAAVSEWFPDSLAVPIALVVLGLVLVGLAVRVVRRGPAVGEPRLAVLPRRAAVVAATVVAVAAVPAVAVVGALTG